MKRGHGSKLEVLEQQSRQTQPESRQAVSELTDLIINRMLLTGASKDVRERLANAQFEYLNFATGGVSDSTIADSVNDIGLG